MQRWKLIAAGGAATGMVVLGGGVAYGSAVGTTAANPSPQATASGQAHPNRAGHRARPLVRRAVHGTITVRTRKGFKNVNVQRGKITGLSGNRVTVTSPDKFTRSYTMNGDTRVRLNRERSERGKVAKGQHAYVITSPKAGTSVARLVVVRSK